jgi:hypothetical protein
MTGGALSCDLLSAWLFHYSLGRLNFLRKFAEASAVQVYQKRRLHPAPSIEIRYDGKDASKWEVDNERDASEFEAAYLWEVAGKGAV